MVLSLVSLWVGRRVGTPEKWIRPDPLNFPHTRKYILGSLIFYQELRPIKAKNYLFPSNCRIEKEFIFLHL
jgi:hypothetical protein